MRIDTVNSQIIHASTAKVYEALISTKARQIWHGSIYDQFTSTLVQINPLNRIIEEISFNSVDPDYAGKMIMDIQIKPVVSGTRVTIICSSLVKGISAKDNEVETQHSLQKLADYVEN